MKNLKLLFTALAFVVGLSAFAATQKATIKTSAQCDMCKERIETALLKVKGVQKVLLNPESKELTVKFDDSIVTLAQIEEEVTKIGYWANDKTPNKDAYNALPTCCKPQKSCCASKSSCSKEASSTEGQKAGCSGAGAEKKECAKPAEGQKSSESGAKSCEGHAH